MNRALSTTVVLSATAYDLIWERENLGPQHNALSTSSLGESWTARDALSERVFADLQLAGLANGNRIRPDIYDALKLLAQAQREVYGWFTRDTQGHTTGIVAAANDYAGVLATLHQEVVCLTPIQPTELISAVLAWLPKTPPRSGPVLNFALAELESGHIPAAYQAKKLFTQPRFGVGQFHAAIRKNGSRTTSSRRVDYFDTADGRFLACERISPDGAQWGLVLPGTQKEFATQLVDLVAEINRECCWAATGTIAAQQQFSLRTQHLSH